MTSSSITLGHANFVVLHSFFYLSYFNLKIKVTDNKYLRAELVSHNEFEFRYRVCLFQLIDYIIWIII
jgi:hypothetical protein